MPHTLHASHLENPSPHQAPRRAQLLLRFEKQRLTFSLFCSVGELQIAAVRSGKTEKDLMLNGSSRAN